MRSCSKITPNSRKGCGATDLGSAPGGIRTPNLLIRIAVAVSVGTPRVLLDRSHCRCGWLGCCVSCDSVGWCVVAGDYGGLFVTGRDADRDEQFPAGSGCSGGGRSGRLADLSSRQRAVRCCPANVFRRRRAGRRVARRAGRGGVRPTPGDRAPGDRGHGERLRVCPVRPRWAQVVWSVSLGQPMPGADGWTGRPRIPRSEDPARSLIIGPTPGQNPSASTGAWPHGVQRLGYCSRSLPC